MITGADMNIYGRVDQNINAGFGNKLFIIASTIGIAVKYGLEYGWNWNNQDFFVNPLPLLKPGNYQRYNVPWGYYDFVCKDNTCLVGYMQHERYFSHCEDLIRSYFEMKPVSEKLVNTVGLHFRAYSVEGVGSVHPELPREYYEKALKHFPGKTPVVFTDNIERAKQVIGLDCEYRSNTPIEDFYQLRHCDGVIMCASSFSWWCGWLNGRAVIPSYWFIGRNRSMDVSGLYSNKFIIE